jgi:hypothetical protein
MRKSFVNDCASKIGVFRQTSADKRLAALLADTRRAASVPRPFGEPRRAKHERDRQKNLRYKARLSARLRDEASDLDRKAAEIAILRDAIVAVT